MAIQIQDNEGRAKIITELVRSEILEQQEDFISKSVEEYEKALREKLGKIALKMLSHYDVSMRGQNLTITVRNDLKQQGSPK